MKREDQVYDRGLFIEVIMSYPTIKFLRSDSFGEFHIQFYEGLSGRPVIVDSTDLNEDITFSEGCGLLRELGIADLIDILFPPIKEPTDEQENALLEDVIMKEEALKGLDN